jgi:hypothetical protein
MKISITTLAIVAILVAGLGALASLIPIHQASAAPGAPKYANGSPSPNSNAFNQGTSHAYSQTPANQPCSTHC